MNSSILRLVSVLILALLDVSGSTPQIPTDSIKLSFQQRAQLHDLVLRVLQNADQVGCKKGKCAVLVTNFMDEQGNTSVLGMQLAEEVSKDFAFAIDQILSTPRSMLQSYLESERIPSKDFKDTGAMRWLGRELSADCVLIGTLKSKRNNLELELQLLENKQKENEGRQSKKERIDLPGLGNAADLSPKEPFGTMPEVVLDGEHIPSLMIVHDPSGPEITAPQCTYMPDPPYTEAARQRKYQGNVILQTVISKDGVIADVEPLQGAPFGFNSISVATVRTWKCQPSTVNGKAISAVVPIEITFRLF